MPSGATLRVLTWSALAGTLSVYGDPGIAVAGLFQLALIIFAFAVARAPSALIALLAAIAFGLSAAGAITISSASWGNNVAVALMLFGIVLHCIPHAFIAYWVSRHLTRWRSFLFVIAAWSLCITFADLVGFPIPGEATSLVTIAPVFMGGARLVGNSVVTGVIVAGTMCTGIALARAEPHAASRIRALMPFGIAVVVLLGASGVAHLLAPASIAQATVGVPQMATPSVYFKYRQATPDRQDEFEALFSKQLQALSDVDLIVLTETYDGAQPLLVPSTRQRFESYAKLQHQAILLTSYLAAEDGGGYNAAGAIDANGTLVGVHRKVDLAPFGERELEPGSRFRSFPILPGIRAGVSICQEAVLPDGVRDLVKAGANLVLTPTSDISFGSGILTFNHLAIARLRSLESGRDMVWASAAGPSGAISRWGNFEQATPFREVSVGRMHIDAYDDVTPYLRTRLLWPALGIAVVVWLLSRHRAARFEIAPFGPVSTIRSSCELGAVLAFGAVTCFGSPALVELRSGRPSRARFAVEELTGRVTESPGPASLDRFKTDLSHSASGAVAYYLDFYGVRAAPSSIHLPQGEPSFADLAHALNEFGFPARTTTLDPERLPKSATLVRTREGEYGVLVSNRSRISLFSPTRGLLVPVFANSARAQLEADALVPATDPDLARFPP